MIRYDNLWATMKEKGISEYRLYTYHGISRQTIYKLRHNELVSLHTVNKLCNILDVPIEDICTFYKDDGTSVSGIPKKSENTFKD